MAVPIDGAVRKALARDSILEHPANDHGNAKRILDLHGGDMFYSYSEHAFKIWDDKRFARDINGAAMRLAKATMLRYVEAALATGDRELIAFAKRSLDHAKLTSALASLQCERPAEVQEFDQDRNLLNFMNGTVDLRTGEIAAHDKAQKITKLIHYDYKPEATCPAFLRFLDRVMGGGPDASEGDLERARSMVNYLQLAIGYSLTGETSEKAVFIAHGPGSNGKSTLLEVIRQLVPEYSAKILIDSLMAKPGGESSNTLTDLADLRGARFVNTSETEHGQRLSEGRLKRITQGMGTIKSVRKYENPITFLETHKLWVDANHLPVIAGSENAIWNRLHTIPFTVVIAPEEMDRQLSTKLLAEAEGILAWCVAGAVRWYADGLKKPVPVTRASAEWREDSDSLAPFVEEMCELRPNDAGAWVEIRVLRKAYVDWLQREEEHKRPVSTAEFNAYLESRGLQRDRRERNTKRVWVGVQFKAK
ncbi:MAG: hypothetical protein JO340_16190 [Acidobacteriaceae bacterium]|nr:hypothetical protein [Acidobacteriaceae bacterium]